MYVYINDFIHSIDGIYNPNFVFDEFSMIPANLIIFENGLEIVLPKHYDIPTTVTMQKPVTYGIFEDEQLCNLFGILTAYSVITNFSVSLFVPNYTLEDKYALQNKLEQLAKLYLKKDISMPFNVKTDTIDITEFYKILNDNFKFNIHTVHPVILNSDYKGILSYLHPFIMLFTEVNKGYFIRMQNDVFIKQFTQLLLKIGIVPVEIAKDGITIKRKDFNALKELLSHFKLKYKENVKLKVKTSYPFGIRQFYYIPERYINKVIGINGILKESIIQYDKTELLIK
ncbi:MAG: hypothetical protein QXO21_06490 [Candidatus Anstonellales archaeon]